MLEVTLEVAADLVAACRALADDTRFRIVQLLTGGTMCACKILEHFQITQPSLSYHMKLLTESGLVSGHRDGAWMRYTLSTENIRQLARFFGDLANDTSSATTLGSALDTTLEVCNEDDCHTERI